MKHPTPFRDKLTLIALDEAHTIWSYKGFRKEFSEVHQLRIAFPKVPFAAFSATFPPHIVSYVQQTLRLKLPTKIITYNGRRTNINILVAEQPSRKTFEPLLDLIPAKINAIEEIPKTFVFVDSVKTARRIAIALRRKFRKKRTKFDMYKVIRCYYSCIDEPTKDATHRFVKNGDTRIVICTDSLSLGVDFPDIEKVIQWGVDDKLDLDTLVQRIGRAARNQELQGVGLIYAHIDLLEPVSKAVANANAPESPPLPTSQSSTVISELGLVEPFPYQKYQQETDGIIPCYQDRELPEFMLPVTRETLTQAVEFTDKMYKRAEKIENILKEARAEQNAPKKQVPGVVRTRKKPIDKIEPALLWFLNTTGCRQRCILHYLRYRDVFTDHLQKSWCCDNCAIQKQLPLETTSTAGVFLIMSVRASPPEKSREPLIASPQVTPTRPVVVKRISSTLRKRLENYRAETYSKLRERGVLPSFFPLDLVIPDPVLNKLVSRVANVHTVQSIREIFARARFSVNSSLLRDKEVEEIFNLVNYTIEEHIHMLGIRTLTFQTPF
ncbi:MAG: hypothetical protein E6J34_12735 [Chloroflexi bacterium]|nr:MAG: hypothetical protein E6J34_12735 [Chloroflexota bacterium]